MRVLGSRPQVPWERLVWSADGRFVAYNATTGEKLWESPTGTGVVAAPMTYSIDGQQYVAVLAGWGGAWP